MRRIYYIVTLRYNITFVSIRWIYLANVPRPEYRLYSSHTVLLRFVFKERYEINDVTRATREREREIRRARTSKSSCYNLVVDFSDPAFHSSKHFLLSSRIFSRDRIMMHSWSFLDPASHPNFRSKISRSVLVHCYHACVRFLRCLSLNRSI